MALIGSTTFFSEHTGRSISFINASHIAFCHARWWCWSASLPPNLMVLIGLRLSHCLPQTPPGIASHPNQLNVCGSSGGAGYICRWVRP